MKSKGGGKDSPSLFAGLMQELQPMVGIASPEGKSVKIIFNFNSPAELLSIRLLHLDGHLIKLNLCCIRPYKGEMIGWTREVWDELVLKQKQTDIGY